MRAPGATPGPVARLRDNKENIMRHHHLALGVSERAVGRPCRSGEDSSSHTQLPAAAKLRTDDVNLLEPFDLHRSRSRASASATTTNPSSRPHFPVSLENPARPGSVCAGGRRSPALVLRRLGRPMRSAGRGEAPSSTTLGSGPECHGVFAPTESSRREPTTFLNLGPPPRCSAKPS